MGSESLIVGSGDGDRDPVIGASGSPGGFMIADVGTSAVV